VRRARDAAWRTIAPRWDEARAVAASGLPVQIAEARRYERRPDARAVARALARGATVFMPQVHQVLPRVARLMVALRATFLGPIRDECSFLFIVAGQGREAMGLHHDGDVDSFWLQLAGRRTVTIGPPVVAGTPEDLEAPAGGRGWWTGDLLPGTLFYMPPRTPHRVLCRGRSLALSLTWRLPPRRRPSPAEAAASLAAWDVASGHVASRPRRSRARLWTQVPAIAGAVREGRVPLWTPSGRIALPAAARALGRALGAMPSFARRELDGGPGVDVLVAHGVLGDEDLPLRIVPDDTAALDGWRFA
jgi:hypothetical protein